MAIFNHSRPHTKNGNSKARTKMEVAQNSTLLEFQHRVNFCHRASIKNCFQINTEYGS